MQLNTLVSIAATILLVSCSGGGSNSTPNEPSTPLDDSGISFDASRQVINEGETTLIRWTTIDATSVEITPDIGAVPLSGEREITLTESTVLTLNAYQNGNLSGQRTLDITVRPNAAVQITANVLSGPAPLTVRFTPIVQSNTAINRLYWEFEGNGGTVDGGLGIDENGFDPVFILGGRRDFDVTGRDVAFTYELPGTYTAKVRVWDANANQTEATVQINVTNAAPRLIANSSSASGAVPLQVTFDVHASDDDTISMLQWDFDGDGIVDDEISSTRKEYRGSTRFTYENVGTFQPVVTMIDALGESTRYEMEHLIVSPVVGPVPLVSVSLRTFSGPAPLEVLHSMSSRSQSGSRVVSYEWDFNGDGIIDLTGQETRVNHTYMNAGKTVGAVTAVTEDGLRITNRFAVDVLATYALSVQSTSIDPATDSATIDLTGFANSEFDLTIESANGDLIKTLLGKQLRTAGDYSAVWDGTNTAGQIQPPGDYYAIINTSVDGVDSQLDLRGTTGGDIFYPNGWTNNANGCRGSTIRDCGFLTISDNVLEPFAQKPVVYDISTPLNSRMSAYVTIIGSENFAATTFFRSRLMSAGDTRLVWHGTASDGKFVPFRTRNGYLPAIYGITLASNSIVLNHRTSLDSVSVTPDIFHPMDAGSTASTSVISFDLSRNADVTMTIDNTAQGVNVFQETFVDLPAGAARELTWDGRDNLGRFVGPGGYVITLTATDTFGQETIARKAMQRVEY